MVTRTIPAQDLRAGMEIVEMEGKKHTRFRVMHATPHQMGSEMIVEVKNAKGSALLWRYSVPATVQVI